MRKKGSASRARFSAVWLPLAVVLISTVYPRLLMLGFFPSMDDGVHGYRSQLIHQGIAAGQGLIDALGFSFYPLLLYWTFDLPGNPVIWLRLADMLAAAWAGWLLCRILERESGNIRAGCLLALAFLCCMNAEQVLVAGYNGIFAAYVPLFLALSLSLSRPRAESPRWFAVGALVALAVLLREPFSGFAVFGLAAVWLSRGFKAAWRYALGGALTGVAVLAVLGFLRGGVAVLVNYYIELGDIYAAEAWRVSKKFVGNGLRSLGYFAGPLSLTVIAAVLLGREFHGRRRAGRSVGFGGRALFWLGAALLPLLEPLSKIGSVYHFAVCLPGCAGLCALAWRQAAQGPLRPGGPGRKAALTGIILACLSSLLVLPDPGKARMTLDVLRAFPSRSWPKAYVSQSNTLLAARALKRIVPPGGTLSSSGHSFFLNVTTGILPPSQGPFAPRDSFRLSDLSRTFIAVDHDVQRLAEVLRANPPDAAAVGFTHEDHSATFAREIVAAVERSGLYELATVIPIDQSKDYGWMGYVIYRKKAESHGANQQ